MRELMMRATSGDMRPEELSQQTRASDSREMGHRRAIVGASLIGIAAMAVVSLLQTGVVKHLPDPPVKKPHFDSDKGQFEQGGL